MVSSAAVGRQYLGYLHGDFARLNRRQTTEDTHVEESCPGNYNKYIWNDSNRVKSHSRTNQSHIMKRLHYI
jgi:hypothetical protein